MTSSKGEPLHRGEDLVGYVVLTGCDHYWILGSFTPGPDYEKYRLLFEQERELSRRTDASDELNNTWTKVVEAIDELELTWGDPGKPIRDFKIDERFQVEFRLDF